MIGVDFEHRLLAVHQKRKLAEGRVAQEHFAVFRMVGVKHLEVERRLVGPKGNQDLLGVGRKRVTIECEGHHAPASIFSRRSCSSSLGGLVSNEPLETSPPGS